MNIAFIGGTGNLGYGLAARFANAGKSVTIGSRDVSKAESVANEITLLTGKKVFAAGNQEAADKADIVFLAVPAAAQEKIIAAIKDVVREKIIVDTTVSLRKGKTITVSLLDECSSSQKLASQLGDSVKIVSAFHTVSGKLLSKLDRNIEGDILVCGDNEDAKETLFELIKSIGGRPVDAGPLEQSGTLERLTALIIGLNIRYKRKHIGIHFTGM